MKQTVRILIAGLLCAAALLNLGCEDDPISPPPIALEVQPDSMFFDGTSTQPIQRQSLVVLSTGSSVPYTATASNSRLRLSNADSSTPDTILVQFITLGQADGLYVDSLIVSSNAAENSPIVVPVVTSLAPFIATDTDSINFVAKLGAAVTDTQTVALSTTSDSLIQITTQTNQSWLRASTDADTLPASLSIWLEPAALAPGTHSGTVTVSSPTAGNDAVVKVTVEVLQWIVQTSLASTSLRDVYFLDRNNGWAAGILPNIGSNDGVIFTTTDGGDHWILGEVYDKQAIGAIRLFPDNTGWFCGTNAAVRRTVNGGATWINITTPFTALDNIDYQALAFITSDTGWIIGDSGVIIYTDDAGVSWTTQTVGITPQQLRGISAVDADHAWAVGNSGTIFVTSNGGARWTRQTTPGSISSTDWDDVAFIDTLTGFVVGKLGRLLSTTDGGDTWILHETFSLSDSTVLSLDRITFATPSLGFIVGGETYLGQAVSSVIIRTTDGGQTWHYLPSGTIPPLRSVFFVDTDHGWAVGSDGFIIHTEVGSN